MVTLLGNPPAKRDAAFDLTRRRFLKIGGLVVSGLSLPQLLAIEAKAGVHGSRKSLINIYMPGGPSHIDLWDLKPDAPSEIRGEFRPIKTNVPAKDRDEWPHDFRPLAPLLLDDPRLASPCTVRSHCSVAVQAAGAAWQD